MGKGQNIRSAEFAASREAGFSLLETLFALAIMSIASVALFQSTASMLRLSDRAVKAGERTVNGALDRLAVTRLLGAIMPNWPDLEDISFTGESRRLSALSATPISTETSGPQPFTLSFIQAENGTHTLIYVAGALLEETGEDKDKVAWPLIKGLSAGARFEYMGVDQNWYGEWPPDTKPTRGYFNDAELMPAKTIPEAVRLRDQDVIILSAAISESSTLPPRPSMEGGL